MKKYIMTGNNLKHSKYKMYNIEFAGNWDEAHQLIKLYTVFKKNLITKNIFKSSFNE
jgi:hypothetical protein